MLVHIGSSHLTQFLLNHLCYFAFAYYPPATGLIWLDLINNLYGVVNRQVFIIIKSPSIGFLGTSYSLSIFVVKLKCFHRKSCLFRMLISYPCLLLGRRPSGY